MADSSFAADPGTGGSAVSFDTRTEATNGNHRSVIVIGDPSTNAGVAPVDATNGLSVTLTTAIPAGSAAIGKLAANSGVDIGDVDVTSVTPGSGATNLGKAEDAAHASGDVGVMALGVRKDTAAATSGTDGDYNPVSVNARGATWVAIEDGAGGQITSFGGGTQYTEDAAAAANPVGTVPILVRKDTPASEVSADGDNIAQRGTAYGASYVTLLDTAGSPVSVGGGTQYTEDAAAAANPIGNALMLVREDARAGSLTSADGDNVAARGTNAGELYVKHVDAIPVTDNAGSLTVDGTVSVNLNASTNTIEVVGDAAHDAVVAGNPVLIGAYAKATAQTDVSADGDVARLWCDLAGRLQVGDGGSTLSVDDGGGSLTVDGTVAVTNSDLATIAGAVRAEDAASADGHTGIPAMAVRKATPANTSGADGDYEMLQMSAGRLWVDPSGVTLTVASHAVTNAGTFAVQVDGSALTSLQLIDDVIFSDDAAFTPGTSKVAAIGMTADETSTDSVDEGDIGVPRITLDRKQIVSQYAHTAGGATPYKLNSAASTNATNLKNAAGQVYMITASNTNAAVRYLKFYNKSSSPTVGTDTPILVFAIPGNTAGAGTNIPVPDCGLLFDTGISFALTTGAADSDTGAVAANEIIVNIGYK